MAWFGKTRAGVDASEKRTIGRGVFRKCDACNVTLRAEDFTENHEVCPECGHHYRLSGEAWVDLLLDPGSFEEQDTGIVAGDPLGFVDERPYRQRLDGTRKKTGLDDAMLVGSGTLDGRGLQFGAFLFRFMGGSMGSVVGEKITRMFERGIERKEPVVLLSASGGARMQEGVLSLMQMAKTVAALRRLREEANQPFVSVLLNPTTGGVAASFALLGDVNIAEPEALIGFAGPRVIENTIRQKLPEGFQRAEFLLEHGMIDVISERRAMRATIARFLSHLLD
jgi:acetyl-CoA carboxylase carboxyl transferase subunit beta